MSKCEIRDIIVILLLGKIGAWQIQDGVAWVWTMFLSSCFTTNNGKYFHFYRLIYEYFLINSSFKQYFIKILCYIVFFIAFVSICKALHRFFVNVELLIFIIFGTSFEYFLEKKCFFLWNFIVKCCIWVINMIKV